MRSVPNRLCSTPLFRDVILRAWNQRLGPRDSWSVKICLLDATGTSQSHCHGYIADGRAIPFEQDRHPAALMTAGKTSSASGLRLLLVVQEPTATKHQVCAGVVEISEGRLWRASCLPLVLPRKSAVQHESCIFAPHSIHSRCPRGLVVQQTVNDSRWHTPLAYACSAAKDLAMRISPSLQAPGPHNARAWKELAVAI